MAGRQLLQLTDTYTNLQNRLRTVTDGQAQLAAVTERLFTIANTTRTAYEATVEVFARTALSAKDLGVSLDELINFSESLNQAVLLSGASAAEANNALIQLSQGIASGTLRGDELRSVLEQLPVVADVISQHLGITRGELRLLGTQGKITAFTILEAFKAARGELAGRFLKAVPTVSQAFAILRNNVIKYIGASDQAIGASRSLAQAVILVSNNMDTLGMGAQSVAFFMGVVLAGRAIPSVITGVRLLTATIAANPLGALGIALLAVTSYLVGFRNEIKFTVTTLTGLEGSKKKVQTTTVTLGDAIVATAKVIREDWIAAVNASRKSNASFSQSVKDIGTSFEDLGPTLVSAADRIYQVLATLQATIVALPSLAAEGVEAIANLLISGTGAQLNVYSGTGGRFLKAIQDIFSQNPISDFVGRAEKVAVQRAQTRSKDQERDRLERERAEAGLSQAGTAKTVLSAQDLALQDYVKGLRQETQLLSLNNEERAIQSALFRAAGIAKRELTTAERENITELAKQRSALSAQDDVYQKITQSSGAYERQVGALRQAFFGGRINVEQFTNAFKDLRQEFLQTQTDEDSGIERFLLRLQKTSGDAATQIERELGGALASVNQETDQYAARVRALNILLDEGVITVQQFTQAQGELRLEVLRAQTDLRSGVLQGLISIQETAGNTAVTIQTSLVNAFSRAEDAFARFATRSSVNFRDLVNSILADLARLAFRRATSSLVSSVLGSVGGASAGASTGGGTVNQNALRSSFSLGRASGGLVSGPGSGTSDSIDTRLSNGEFVVNAQATRNNLALLNRVNQGQRSGGGGMVINGGPVTVVFEDGPDGGQLTPEQAAQIGAEVRTIAQLEAANVFEQAQRPGGVLFESGRAA